YCRMNILHRLWRQEQYYTAFLGGFAAMPLTSGIIKRLIRFIRNKYKSEFGNTSKNHKAVSNVRHFETASFGL
ncbi:MAG: hypothetical protein J6K89_06920, partial [Oscillospiraceae bacterium]|nr:hypothetical protein [Oscillospiraceae bacterium]